MVFNMWLPLTLLVLAGTVAADYEHGWKVGNEYTYLVRSRTLTGLDKLSDQYSGILLKALLTVQAKDENTLIADVSKCQYARIHKQLPDGWDSEISDQMLELQHLPLSGRPFEIKMKHGLIRDLIVDRDIPTWELNILKSIISQLQVDTQGENAIRTRSMTIPNDDEPYGMFHAMEDSVGGKCEVLYDFTPLPEHMVHINPELVPKPELKGEGLFIDIVKTKNFSRCDQRMDYHFGITGFTNWEPGSNDNGNFMSKSSTSRIIVSGNLKRFVIQSSVTTSKMHVSPRFYDQQNGVVVSMMKLTLANMNRIKSQIPISTNRESTGNLVYVYNNPFSDTEDRRPGKQDQSLNSNQQQTSNSMSSVSSSEEKDKQKVHVRGSASSASSSSISSSEENQFWQPKPTLDEAPQISLLPNFIGYKGKYIGKSGEINMVETTKKLVSEIAQGLESLTNNYIHEHLERFTILSELIRTMSRKQLMDAERGMRISSNDVDPNDKSQAVKQNARAVFRDAVAQAGTGPALLTIKNWIEKEEMNNMEAANIVARIPKNARAPTAEYVKTFFELASNEKVKENEVLGIASILAFTELVRLSQINGRSIHNRYPVHTFGRLTSKHDQTVVEKYIPYLERELKDAIQTRNSPWIQTYIMALGNIGHPKILSIFEPYLEGMKPVTVFQRSLMVASLSKLATMNPKLARSVLYKIYLNTMESHEVRCMAVFLLMGTKPPMSMLQRMADYTKYDTDKQVNSAVKSSIEGLASLTTLQFKDVANRARAAMNLLSKKDYSYQFSHSFIKDSVLDEDNMMQRSIFNYIGSDDSIIPRSMYYGFFSSFGDFKTPPDEIITMISSVTPLFDALNLLNDEPSEKMKTEKIAEELKIVSEEPIPFEGNLMFNTKFVSHFIPFDKRILQKVPSVLSKLISGANDEHYVNWNKWMSYDVTLSFPTETGLPFVFDFHVPTLYKISGQNRIKIDETLNVDANLNNRMLYARKIQGRIGFVTPFEHQHFVSGIDVNLQTYAPIKVDLGVNTMKQTAKVKVWPLKGEEKALLMHFSVIPYTSVHDILSLRPLTMEKNTHMVSSEIMTNDDSLMNIKPFRLKLEADKTNQRFWSWDIKEQENIFAFPWSMITDEYCKIDLFLDAEGELKEPMMFTVSIDSMDVKPGSEERVPWTPLATTVEPFDKKANSEGRRKQFLKEVSKGIKAARSDVVDLELQLPGVLKSNSVVTVAWSNSKTDNKQRSLLYWNFDLSQNNIGYEVCAATKTMSTDNILPSYKQAINTVPRQDFDVAIRYGKTCSENNELNIKGKLVQSTRMKEIVMKSPVVKECQEQMKHGNTILEACQVAAGLALTVDEMDISMNIQSPELLELSNMVFDNIEDFKLMDLKVDTTSPKNVGTNTIDIKAKLSSDLENVDLSVHTPTMDLTDNIDLSSLGITYEDLIIVNDRVDDTVSKRKLGQTCVVDKTRTQTFDGKEYPIRLGKCWHTVMTTYPKLNPDNPKMKLLIPTDKSVSILTRDTDDETREVKILLGNDEIVLLPDESQSKVMMNGQSIDVTKDMSYQKREEDEIVFEIYRLKDNSIGLESDKHDISLAYDRKRILIDAFDYSKSVRGLCGNIDGDESNDFLGPKNCILKKPEEFIASYALIKEECEGESMKLAKLANRFECTPQEKNHQRNVISDVEAGRASIESPKWGYHQGKEKDVRRCSIHRTQVIEEDDKICFTTRPIVACAPTCSAIETVSKSYQFHCMKRSEAALKMKKRIEKGANPDLSQKPVSMSRPVNVPLACKA